ncbi:hypothetical protein PVAND_005241 [Polypedilum vanderplanki]|uniref:Codanin-1 C-terminal domain-containing protein n=1 Tax=Polypedilum vanderplanki TaxID=319348 RepID=A0A9J6C0I9_POLVA|nr:hypothetical protein PVAND_005241 [Polypedilum vanderplanki]
MNEIFIKNNTSTCNTPHKIQLNTITTTDADKSSVGDFDGRSSSFQRQHANFPQENRSGKSTKRQISRELFVNQDKSDCDNNQNRVVANSSSNNNNESRGQRATSRGVGGKSQSRRLFNESFPEIDNPSFQSTSTPNNMLTRMNKSMGEGEETATPNSSFFSRNSLSFDQSRGGNSSRKSFENHSMSRRNTSSPLCLADFINTSNASSKGGSRKKNNISSDKLQQQQQQQSKVNDMAKPKKRVMPITVSRKASTETPNFISSSFQSENNLLHITTLEADESMPAMPEREILREQRDAISKDFHNEAQTSVRNLHALIKENLAASPLQASQSGKTVTAVEYDEKKVDRRDMLMIMAKIYSFIIDMNYVPNILSEISYLVNLLNSEYNPYEHQSQNYTQMKTSNDIASNLLKNYHNCIFFASCVLNHQKQTLGMLDCTTIRVICVYERIQTITPVLHEHLRKLMQVKMQMDSLMSSHRARSDANDINKVVFYQQETDNRDNFPSDREFMAFKKQRDLFYAILRSWELKHLDPLWDFRANLGMKVRGLLTLLEHPINMAHLAKLFTSQLIISCNFDNELQMALPNIDLSKLSKLRQRLVAPSLFGTQYLFPGNQAFFRDFIICSDFHMMFTEQLKIALISELLQMNDSSMETLSIVAWGNCNKDTTTAAASTNVVVDDDDKEKSFRQEFIVRAETISTMRVIGKFIGFVVSRSYSYDGYRNSLVDQKQMNIRNFIHPDFDVKSIVLRAIGDRKLLVTIPWLVEYLSMLDFITIRLNYYRELFQILYTIYMNVNALPSDENKFCVMPQSNFIVRTCLGWLFEHPNIPEDYYNPGMMLSNIHIASSPPLADCIKVSNASMNNELNPHLENILHAACPFLADFRVSMMPQRTRTEKAVSRTGRYRHITTKIQDKPATGGNNLPQSNREKLIEAFLASQSLSVRKIVDITIDRVSSAVIKDFQVQHMLSVRKEARSAVEIEALTIKSLEPLQKRMRQVYNQYLDRLHELWTEDTTANCRKRVEAAFDALLPVETLNDVKKTLINITIEKINEKLQQWRVTNISMEIFSNDIIADATKLIEGIGTQELIGSSRITPQNVIIDISVDLQPYEYFEMLQKNLHLASLHPETLTIENILTLIEKSEIVFNKHILPSNFYRNIAFNLLQLILLLIVNCPELITKDLLTKLFNVWRHEKLLDFTIPDRTKCNNDEDANDNENEKNHRRYRQQLNKRFKYKTFIFSNVISSRFMLMMTGKDRKNFEVYGNFLIELIKEKFITVEDVNELSVGLYKYEWSKSTLDDIAFLVHHVKSFLSSTSTSSTAATDENAESHLFMELVADLAREMENF